MFSVLTSDHVCSLYTFLQWHLIAMRFLQGPKTCFLDTLSLHTCIAGLTAHQKLTWLQQKNSSHSSRNSWMKVGAPNALEHVYKYHCNGGALDKTVRDVFVKGTVDDIRKDFQVQYIFANQKTTTISPTLS